MKSLSVRAFLLAAGLTAACGSPSPPPSPPPAPSCFALSSAATRLGPSERLAHAPAAAERTCYALELAAGSALELHAVQRGVDVKLRFAPAGSETAPERVIVVDSPTERAEQEELFVVVDEGGQYRLEVEAGGLDAGGSFELVVEALRPATPEDRHHAGAFQRFAQAEELRRQRTPEARLQALPLYDFAIAAWRQPPRRLWLARALLRRADVLRDLGRGDDAFAGWSEALPLFEAEQDHRREAVLHTRLGDALELRGRTAEATARARRAFALYRDLGDRGGEALTCGTLAALEQSRGRTALAELFYDCALDRWERLPGRERDVATTWLNLAKLYLGAAEAELAEAALTKARLTLPAGDRSDTRTHVHLTAGRLELARGKLDAAERELDSALDRAIEQRDDGARAHALRVLARVAFERRDLETAKRHTADALRLLEAQRDLPLVEATRQDLLQLELRLVTDPRGRARVRDELARTLAEARRLEARAVEAAALLGLARWEQKYGSPDLAWTLLTEALELVEAWRSETARGDLQRTLYASVQDFFDLALDLQAELNRARPGGPHGRLALEIAEQARARHLLDELSPRAPATPLGERSRLKERIRSVEEQRDILFEEGASADRIAEHERELVRLSQELSRLDAALAAALREEAETEAPTLAAPALAAPAGPVPTASSSTAPDIDAVLASLTAADTVLVVIDLGAEVSHLLFAEGGEVEIFPLPAGPELEAAAREAHELFAHSHQLRVGHRPAQVARELGRRLLEPVATRLEHRRVLLVPDGALQLLPWAALEVPGPPGASSTGRTLGEHCELRQAPSAAVTLSLARRERARARPPRVVATFADPVFERDDERFLGLGPLLELGSAASTLGGEQQTLEREAGTRLTRLPFTRIEAELLRELVPQADRFEALGFDATRERLAAVPLASYRMLHFATHGLFVPERPERSGLVLSRYDRGGRALEGAILRAYDIERLPLAAELVTLSACRTAQGRQIRGEGVVSLAHAFFEAGASRVIVSLWPVNDASTAALMRSFYAGLLEQRLSPAAALRRAQLEVRATPGWQAPYHWAGFILLGAD